MSKGKKPQDLELLEGLFSTDPKHEDPQETAKYEPRRRPSIAWGLSEAFRQTGADVQIIVRGVMGLCKSCGKIAGGIVGSVGRFACLGFAIPTAALLSLFSRGNNFADAYAVTLAEVNRSPIFQKLIGGLVILAWYGRLVREEILPHPLEVANGIYIDFSARWDAAQAWLQMLGNMWQR
ncbi:MAG: hypothetical protein KatS3mg084_0381 [Candidatus Dojkabacteria bacterium]|nr:MAG: hypothetical protein KatS3mg084_0381 [Candidatus Dojkabacteria bacterium]